MIPANFPYKRSQQIDLFDEYASATIAASGVNAALVTFDVPNDVKAGWITEFGHGIDDVTAFVDSIFRIEVNGVPQKNYNNITDQLAPFNDPRTIAPIRIYPNDTVTVYAANNDSVQHLYAGRLRGFYDYAIGG